jgi:hypothetical protein
LNCENIRTNPKVRQYSQYGHHAREHRSPFSSCCQFSNFLQQLSLTDSLSGSQHTSIGDADLSNDCLHGVLDLLHLFGSVHVAVATLLGVNQGTSALNANLESSGDVGGGFTDYVQLQKQSAYGHEAKLHVQREGRHTFPGNSASRAFLMAMNLG